MILLGFFLTSGCSVLVGIKHEVVIGAWIMGPWWCQICRNAGGYCYRRYGAIMVFSSFWQLCPRQDSTWKWQSCLDHGNPRGAKCAGTPTASATGAMDQCLFWASGSWWSEGFFGWSFSVAWPVQALTRTPQLGSFSVVWCIRHLRGHPSWGPSLLFSLKHLKVHPGWSSSLLLGPSGT